MHYYAFRVPVLFLIIVVFVLPFYPSLAEEQNNIKQEIKELRQMMEKMQGRIDELEEKNRVLEQEAAEEKETEQKEIMAEQPQIEEELDLEIPETGTQSGSGLTRAFQSLNPEISVIGIFSAAWFSEDNPFVFAEIDPQNTGVNIQEIEFAFGAAVDPYFRFDSYFVLTEEGIELEETYATTLLSLPLNSQFRVGKARAKFGRINQLHRHSQNFVTLPLVAAQFLGEHLNPTSIEANFLLPVPWFMELSASGGSPEVETPTFARDEDANNLARLLYIFHVANFFELSESFGVSLGGSFATGSNGTAPGERSNLYGVDLFAKYRPLRNNPYQEVMVQSEFMYRDAETPDENLKDWGFYAQLIYRFAKRWNVGVRYGMTDTDTPVQEEEELEIEPEGVLSVARNEEGEEEEEMLGLLGRAYRISPMLTFNPTEYSRIRLQYDYLNQNYDANQHALYLQFQYSIGAHGSHPF